MQIVTLITDFGTKDFYSGALKGALLNKNPGIQIVDISHDIEPYNIVQAAFVLQNTYKEFPAGTIHLIGVNCVYAQDFQFVCVRHKGCYFVAPDNGLFTLAFGQIELGNVVWLDKPDTGGHFSVRALFANAVHLLTTNIAFENIGRTGQTLLERINLQPVIMPNQMRGTVIHIDSFDNVITNIHKEVFDKVRNGRNFSLYFKRNDPIVFLGSNYCDVALGEPICLFNSAGLLEIAINMGKAAGLLGLKQEDVVEIIFD